MLLLGAVFVFSINAQPVQADGPPIHVVSYGETISSLAQKYGVSPISLIDLNRLDHNGFIAVGQRLVLPSTGSRTPLPG